MLSSISFCDSPMVVSDSSNILLPPCFNLKTLFFSRFTALQLIQMVCMRSLVTLLLHYMQKEKGLMMMSLWLVLMKDFSAIFYTRKNVFALTDLILMLNFMRVFGVLFLLSELWNDFLLPFLIVWPSYKASKKLASLVPVIFCLILLVFQSK